MDPALLDQLTLDGVQTHRRGIERIHVIAESSMQNGATIAGHLTQTTGALVAAEIGSQDDAQRLAAMQAAVGSPAQGAIPKA